MVIKNDKIFCFAHQKRNFKVLNVIMINRIYHSYICINKFIIVVAKKGFKNAQQALLFISLPQLI